MKCSILYIGTHPQITEVILRLLNQQPEWNARAVVDVESLKRICTTEEFKLVLVGAGLSVPEEREVRDYLKSELPATKLVLHYGGGSGLLYAEIAEALK